MRLAVRERVAKKLRKRREELELTQEQLARKVSVSRGSIQAYETGSREPSLDTLEQLAVALKTDLVDLVAPPDEAEQIRLYIEAIQSLPDDRQEEIAQYIKERIRLYGADKPKGAASAG